MATEHEALGDLVEAGKASLALLEAFARHLDRQPGGDPAYTRSVINQVSRAVEAGERAFLIIEASRKERPWTSGSTGHNRASSSSA